MNTDIDLYPRLFAAFLGATDEKKLLTDAITRIVPYSTPFLDVGAGEGSLARLLAKHYGTSYCAIEQRPDYCQRLRDEGISVEQAVFPDIELPGGSCETVLFSHVLSRLREKWQPPLEKALALLEPCGKLLIVTYRAIEDEWTKLRKVVDSAWVNDSSPTFVDLMLYLGEHGYVRIHHVVTHVRAKSGHDLIEPLAFVYSNGEAEKYEQFMARSLPLAAFFENYRLAKDAYSFPFNHYIIEFVKG